MELNAAIGELQSRLEKHREILETEEASKTTLVLPFLKALGYDIFNPSEVKPEFTCDVGTKKGEKVDYALCVDGKTRILIECKSVKSDLSIKHASQLFRYFAATEARIALLTNGIVYRFFTDSERTNMMDEKPFFVFDLEDYRNSDLRNLAAFQREGFDIDRIVAQAGTLKLQSLVLKEVRSEFSNPSEDLVRMIASRLHDGRLTEAVREKYHQAIQQALASLIREGVNDRLRSAMSVADPNDDITPITEIDDGIETTEVEIEGFNIIRAIGSQRVSPERIVIRDAKSYCAILLDDNNRKTIARLHFNSPKTKHLGLFSGKDEEKVSVQKPVDIFQFSDRILSRISEVES